MMDTLWQDVRYAARSLRRAPGFTAAVVVILALGIGANTAIFSLLDAVVFKSLPLPSPAELLTLYEVPSPRGAGAPPEELPDPRQGTGRYFRFSYSRFLRLREAIGAEGSLTAMTRSSRFLMRLPNEEAPVAARAQLVSGNYFSMLRVPIPLGRPLTEDDARINRPASVAVISDAFWRRVFGANQDAIGRTMVVNGVGIAVVGVATPRFGGAWTDAEADMWLPLALQHQLNYRADASSYGGADRTQPWTSHPGISWLMLVARVPEDNHTQVRARLQTANHQGLLELVDSMGATADSAAGGASFRAQVLAQRLVVDSAGRGFSGLRARYSEALMALSVLVGLVLLIACGNITNLLLARLVTRSHEMAMRASLGAMRWRLLRQCLVESLLLASAGGTAGLIVGHWSSGALARSVLDTTWELPSVFSLDTRVLVFTTGMAVATAIAFGLLPAVRATRVNLASGIHQRRAGAHAPMKTMGPLVAAQLGLSFVAVFTAILLGQSFVKLTAVDVGFQQERLVTVSFDPVVSGYAVDQMPALAQRLVETAEALPDATSAVISQCGLAMNCRTTTDLRIEGTPEVDVLQQNWIGPRYFSTVGIPLVDGREFDERDGAGPRVAIVSESLAKRFFPGQPAVGRRLGMKELDTEIVGVVRETRRDLRAPPEPMVYFPLRQSAPFPIVPHTLEVRVTGDPGLATRTIRQAVGRAEPSLLVDSANAMSVQVDRRVTRERVVTQLASAFGVLALILAGAGVYSVLSYTTMRRRAEIGVRIAIGARPADIAQMVFKDAWQALAIGLTAGVVGVFWSTRLVDPLLFNVTIANPVAYVLTLSTLIGATLAASCVPAMRAVRVDPAKALRAE